MASQVPGGAVHDRNSILIFLRTGYIGLSYHVYSDIEWDLEVLR